MNIEPQSLHAFADEFVKIGGGLSRIGRRPVSVKNLLRLEKAGRLSKFKQVKEAEQIAPFLDDSTPMGKAPPKKDRGDAPAKNGDEPSAAKGFFGKDMAGVHLGPTGLTFNTTGVPDPGERAQ